MGGLGDGILKKKSVVAHYRCNKKVSQRVADYYSNGCCAITMNMLSRVFAHEGEDSLVDAFAVGEVAPETPAVTAYRYNDE